MDFTGIFRKALIKASTLLDGPMTPEQMSNLLLGLAKMKEATMPKNLLAIEVTANVNSTSNCFPFPILKGNVQLLSVNGVIIRHKFWSWDVKNKILYLLNGYRFMVGQQVEIYYNPE